MGPIHASSNPFLKKSFNTRFARARGIREISVDVDVDVEIYATRAATNTGRNPTGTQVANS